MSEIQEGKIYLVNHQRKGCFFLKVTHVGDEWVTGRIVAGHANALLEENERERGEEITVRQSLAKFTEQLPDTIPTPHNERMSDERIEEIGTLQQKRSQGERLYSALVAERQYANNADRTVQHWVDECDRLRDKLALADTTIHQLRTEMTVMQSRMNEMVPRDGG